MDDTKMNCVAIKCKQWHLEYRREKGYKFQDAESTWKAVTTGAINSYVDLD